MKTLYFVLASLLVACGGVAPTTERVDLTIAPAAPIEIDAAAQLDAGSDAAADAAQEAAPFCECVGADFGTYICDGVQETNAMSCAFCGGHCDNN